MKRIIQEQMGRLCLVLALAWAGLVCALFPVRVDALHGPPQRAGIDRVQVAHEPGRWTLDETVFPAGQAEDYRREDLHAWVVPPPPSKTPKLFLEVPTRANVKPVAWLLPDPGPSLEGADRLPGEDKRSLPLRLAPLERRPAPR